jgi:hypothetical protein
MYVGTLTKRQDLTSYSVYVINMCESRGASMEEIRA